MARIKFLLSKNPEQFIEDFRGALKSIPLPGVPEAYFYACDRERKLFELEGGPLTGCRDAASILTRFLKRQLLEHEVRIVPGTCIKSREGFNLAGYSYHYATLIDKVLYVDATLGQKDETLADKIVLTEDASLLMERGFYVDDLVTPVDELRKKFGIKNDEMNFRLIYHHRRNPEKDNGYWEDLPDYSRFMDDLKKAVNVLEESFKMNSVYKSKNIIILD